MKALTIIVPTANRARFLVQLCRLFAREDTLSWADIIVADGSARDEDAAPTAEICATTGIQYARYPSDLIWYNRLMDVLQSRVHTPLTAVLGDDDVPLLGGYRAASEFLLSHDDYSIAHGTYMAFGWSTTHELGMRRTYDGPSREQDDPLERLYACMSHFTAPTWYAINRTHLLRAAHEAIASYYPPGKAVSEDSLRVNGRHDALVTETIVAGIPLMHGKERRLGVPFCGRLFGDTSTTRQRYSLYVNVPDFPERLQGLIARLDRHRPSGVHSDALRRIVELGACAFLRREFAEESALILGTIQSRSGAA